MCVCVYRIWVTSEEILLLLTQVSSKNIVIYHIIAIMFDGNISYMKLLC